MVWSTFNTDFSLVNTGSLPPESIIASYETYLSYYQNPPNKNAILDIYYSTGNNRLPIAQQTIQQISMSNSMPPNYQTIFDLTYTGNPVSSWECNFDNGYYNDMPDDVQLGFYPNFETF